MYLHYVQALTPTVKEASKDIEPIGGEIGHGSYSRLSIEHTTIVLTALAS